MCLWTVYDAKTLKPYSVLFGTGIHCCRANSTSDCCRASGTFDLPQSNLCTAKLMNRGRAKFIPYTYLQLRVLSLASKVYSTHSFAAARPVSRPPFLLSLF